MKSIERETGINAVRKSVTDDLLCAKVFDNGAIEPALIGGNIGNIGQPMPYWACQRRIGAQGMPEVCGSLVNALAGGGNAQFIHQAVNAFARAREFLMDQIYRLSSPSTG